jgi:hypothetical protein
MITVYKSGETTFKSAAEGLKLMKDENVVVHINEGILKAEFHFDPGIIQSIAVIERHPLTWACVIFPKNSPLAPLFNQATKLLREGGVVQRLQADWEGKEIPKAGGAEVTVRRRSIICIPDPRSLGAQTLGTHTVIEITDSTTLHAFLSQVLSVGQTLLVHAVILFSVGTALVMLVFEFAFKWSKASLSKSDKFVKLTENYRGLRIS